MDFKLKKSNLNFNVYSMPSKPTTAGVENDIAIITSVSMPNWIMSPDKPFGPPRSDGDVWIKYSVAGKITFNALKNNTMMIATIKAWQYVDDAWVDVEVVSYQNGEWHDWIPEGALYYKGVNVGGLVTTGYGTIGSFSSDLTNVSAAFESSNVSFVTTGFTNEPATNGPRTYGYLGTPTMIDLTNVETISVIGTIKSYSNIQRILLMVSKNKSIGTSGQTADKCPSVDMLTGEILKLDVSTLSGSYYVFYMQFDAADVDVEQFILH